MHICTIMSVPYPPEEGIGNYVHGLSTKLIEKGHKVTVITRGSWNKTQREDIDGIEVIRAPFIPIYPFYIHIHGIYVNNIFKMMESQIDIVHIHTPLPPFIKTSLPILSTIHTPMLTDARYNKVRSIYSLFSKALTRFVSYPLEIKLIEASDMVTTVSKSVALELTEYGLNQDEITIVGNGVDERYFYSLQNKSRNNNKYILYAGRIEREKGLFDLLECGKYICDERSDIFFLLAGKGRDLNKLKQKTIEMKLQDKFIFLGHVSRDQIIRLYQKANIFVFPSYHEGFPTVLLEAMSCGLPIVATNVRGNRDLINPKENGIIVPPRSPKKIAEAISLLLEDEKLRKKLGNNARNTIEKNYTWDIISKKMEECYKSLIEV